MPSLTSIEDARALVASVAEHFTQHHADIPVNLTDGVLSIDYSVDGECSFDYMIDVHAAFYLYPDTFETIPAVLVDTDIAGTVITDDSLNTVLAAIGHRHETDYSSIQMDGGSRFMREHGNGRITRTLWYA